MPIATFRDEEAVSAKVVPAEPERLRLGPVVDEGERTLDAGKELGDVVGSCEAVEH